MLRFRRRTIARPRTVVCGAVALFVATQLALGAFLTRGRPEVRDPEFGSLYQALRARLAESPGRPLVLLLGSSRSANLFRPVPPGPGTEEGPDPVVFNFATLYTGPLRELQMLRRLLARGVRPAWVVAEVWTPFLTQRKGFAEADYVGKVDLQPADAAVVGRYFADPWPAYSRLAEAALVPAFGLRSQLLAAYSPFVERPAPARFGDWSNPILRVEGYGWLPAPDPPAAPEIFRDHIRRYQESLRDVYTAFRISLIADGALRELLTTCSRHHIQVAFLLAPEHSSVRACSVAEVQARMNAYLADLTREYGAPVVDTRDWVPDEDYIDSRHVLPPVAAPYTERFTREVLRPLLAGRRLSPRLLLGPAPADRESPPRPTEAEGPGA